jgi:hypothetical protein
MHPVSRSHAAARAVCQSGYNSPVLKTNVCECCASLQSSASFVVCRPFRLACTTTRINTFPPPSSSHFFSFFFPSLLPHRRPITTQPLSASIQILARNGRQEQAPHATVGPYLWLLSMTEYAIALMEGAHAALPVHARLFISQFRRSDEPATGACSNSLFFCPNIGHQGALIAVSRVNGEGRAHAVRLKEIVTFDADGVCDCCDGRCGGLCRACVFQFLIATDDVACDAGDDASPPISATSGRGMPATPPPLPFPLLPSLFNGSLPCRLPPSSFVIV